MNILEYTLKLNDQMSSTLKKVGASSDSTTQDVRELKNEVEGLNGVRLGGFISTMSKIAGVLGIGSILGKSISDGMEQGMKNVSFEVLFGGAEPAKKMIDDITDYASKAYGTSALTNAVQMQAGFDIGQGEIMKNLKAIGDIAMGDVNKFNSLNLAFSQMSSTGKLMGQDLLQMINAGFNPLVQMSKTTGKSVAQLKDEMSKGLITAGMVQQAFYDATSAGGQFNGMIDKMANETGGIWKGILTDINMKLLEFYNWIEPVLNPALRTFRQLLNDPIATIGSLIDKITSAYPVLSTLAIGIGTVTATIWLSNKAIVAYTAVTKALTFFKGIETAAWWANNAAQLANPTTWIIAGVVALIAVIAFLIIKIDGWGKMWEHTVNGAKLIFKAYVESVKFYFNTMVDGIMIGLNYIKKGWYEFKEAVGMGDSTENQKMLAQINADTEARKKAIADSAKKVVDLGIQAKNEFSAAAGSLSWNDTSFSDVSNGLKNKLGISSPGVPGMNNGSGTGGGSGGGGGTGGGTGKDTANSIATGGSKTTHVTINIGEMGNRIVINSSSVKEGATQMRDIILDELTRALSMAQGQI